MVGSLNGLGACLFADRRQPRKVRPKHPHRKPGTSKKSRLNWTGELCLIEGSGMAITQKYTLMCDDMRREDNEKFLLIGVFADAMLSPTFPFTIPSLTFFMKLESDRPGSWSVRMKLEHLDSGQRLLEAMGALSF